MRERCNQSTLDSAAGPSGPSAFKLSRIHAEGWKAAGKLSAGECDDLSLQKMRALNPYASEPAKSHWLRGFADALGS